MCCGGGRRRPEPIREPNVNCDGVIVPFMADAYLMATRRGLDLCSITPTGQGGKIVNRMDVLRALGGR